VHANEGSYTPVARMRPWRRRLLTVVILTLVGAMLVLYDGATGQLGIISLFSPSGPTLQVSAPICGTWETKPAPFPGISSEIELSGIATSPSGSIWIVGNATTLIGEGYHPAMSHWEGNHWRMIGLPDVNREKAYLASAYFVGDADGWAVGHSLAVGPGAIAMHWNGWNWSLTPTPEVLGALYRVRASSADDVWAVGWQNMAQPMQEFPLIMHWDGGTWQEVSIPATMAQTKFTIYDVLPISKDNVWVVGAYDQSGPKEAPILHWDGTNWNTLPTPLQCSGHHALLSISAANTNDIWAVGSCDDGDPTVSQKLAQHWDGTRWTISEVANSQQKLGFLSSVVALSSSDVWSVGTHTYNGVTAFVQHWDGSTWQSIPGPPVTMSPQSGQEIVSVSSRELWLRGYAYQGYNPLVASFVRCP
jgi:hypothetical protein